MHTTPIFRLLVVALLALVQSLATAQPCNPDVTPPVAICDAYVIADVSGGPLTLTPGYLDDGTYDNCTSGIDLDFRLEEAPLSASPPATTNLTYSAADIGEHTAFLWAIDQAGNWNVCASTVIVQDCTGNPPLNLACNANIQVEIMSGETSYFYPQDILEGGPYCLPAGGEFLMEFDPPATPAPSLALDESDAGTHIVKVQVYENGVPGNACWGDIEVIVVGCDNDQTPPTCVAPPDMDMTTEAFYALGIDPQNTMELDATFGTPTAADNCEVGGILQSVSFVNQTCTGNTYLRTITRTFLAYDASGNFAPVVTQVIELLPEFSIQLPADFFPGDPEIASLDADAGVYALIGVNFEDVVYDYDCDGETDKIIRTWGVVNWCQFDNQPATLLPTLDLDGDGHTGDAYEAVVMADSAYLHYQGVFLGTLAPRNEYYTYKQAIRYNYNDTIQFTMAGTVFQDVNADCQFWNEPLLQGWPVHVTGIVSGKTYTATSDANGQFEINLCIVDTLVEVSLDVPFNYGQACPTTYSVSFVPGVTQLQIQDVPVQLDEECPLLAVDIAAPFLRLCFENYYAVSYANLSDQVVEGAYVEVALDQALAFTSADLPEMALGNNTYSFEIGELQPGQYGSFQIYADLDCNAEMGATHCSEAHIYPDTLCPMPSNWSGANIEVDGYCENDSIHLIIRNTGVGDMTAPLEFIVVEDVIMYNQDNFDLDASATEVVLHMPGNGATWRLEAEQEPGHPYPGSVAVAVEGCDGINETGLVNLFFLENPNPFIAVDCQENVSSFDPNDKSAFPAGYDEAHYIERGVAIEYKIRIQNTGTATAFKVVVLDTLSTLLNPETIRPGAGSHPFSFERLEDNVLRFTFSDIMLPDSNTNEAASHGFVQFSVQQMPDLPLGTVIENNAAIYFDSNDPVVTNTVFHTIGEDFIQVIDNVAEAGVSGPLHVFPNPAFDAVTFEFPEEVAAGMQFVLQDQLGRVVRTAQVAGLQYRFERDGLSQGIYYYSFEEGGKKWYTGKVILR
ncbi:MAG: T9SS type A sorting domain-containing protein [Saprospirales bacterium]|nr:T9SS type A sorting domain-containing protein [Saprospirales bacterium]